MPVTRRSGRLALVLLLAAACGCGIPRPRFTDIRSTVAPEGAIVFVAIDPNGTTVTEAHLEWGRRPSLDHGVAITVEDEVPRSFTPFPSTDPITTSWHFRSGQPPQLADDEVVDFQVRLVHSTPDGGTVAFWSERHHFVLEVPAQDVPPGTPTPTAFDPATCSDTTVLVGPRPVPGDEGSSGAVISSDGRFVAFTTTTAFDPADDKGITDVYLRDLRAGTVHRVSAFTTGADTEGGSQPAISGDGRFVAFVSRAMFDPDARAGFDQVYLWDRQAGGVVARVSDNEGFDTDNGGTAPSISHDGRFVAFVSHTRFRTDPNANIDAAQVYLWERNTSNVAASEVVSRASAQGGTDTDLGAHSPSISGDGRFVAFVSRTRYPVDPQANVEEDQIYLWDRDAGGGSVVARVTANDGVDVDRGGTDPSTSADGGWVAFVSNTRFPGLTNPNLQHEQVYRWDRAAARVASWISISSQDVDRGGSDPSVSGDGRLTAFSSLTNFDANFDVNRVVDAYVRCP